ncbi:MAG TPA: cytochrome c oxidase subunit 3, partial [bacterium]|nr:cytochrome c oxidase subunit 3 [bacterium]
KAKAGDARGAAAALGSTAGLGLVFLAVKAAGWAAEVHAGKLPSTNLFFGCYYALTGFEGLHVLIGVGVLLVLAWRAARGDFHARYYSPVLVTGLYWGLLAVVWALILLFLYVSGGAMIRRILFFTALGWEPVWACPYCSTNLGQGCDGFGRGITLSIFLFLGVVGLLAGGLVYQILRQEKDRG